jgi:predicted RNase H-like HicB family nuclease
MAIQLTAIFRQVPRGYVAFVEELPGANTRGSILEEARENLQEAVALMLEPTGSWRRKSSTEPT